MESKKEIKVSDIMTLRSIIEAEYNFLGTFLGDLRSLNVDTKADELDQLLSSIFGSGKRQVIIFSQFGDTVEFLLDYFLPKYGSRLGSYTGRGGSYRSGDRWVLCTKQHIQNKFADPSDPLGLLICTDAASEGLNLQTCDTLINYDIPWNPMRIEQRIGRIDRIGQESPYVDIYTIFYKDSVEEKAYNRCLERIDFFKSALGHLQPILQATEKAIRNAALAQTDQDEDEVFDSMLKEMDESVAQMDENLRIERLLNHYSPRLPIMTNRSPITQEELESIMDMTLRKKGWVNQNNHWIKDGEKITFDQTLMDRKGDRITLITPLSNLSRITGNLPELPDHIEYDGVRIHRIGIEGLTGFIVEKNERFFISHNVKDLSDPKGQEYNSLDETINGLRYLISEQRKKYLETEIKAWNNRRYNWEIRTRMYLDHVAKWRWNSTTKIKGLFEYSRESLIKEWNEYIDSPERTTTKRLAEILKYKPMFDPEERIKGKPSKKSPRDYRKERIFLEDLRRITGKLKMVEDLYRM